MIGRKIFEIWAESSAKWTDWVRPVPFVAINDNYKTIEFYDFQIPTINYIDKNIKNTAIIIDLPNYESILEGIALIDKGFRPIPIFNGTNSQEGVRSTTDNRTIELALIWGAKEIQNKKIRKEAPPAFLIDNNRMHRYKLDDSIFDNSWDIYHQDIPSVKYFLHNEINQIIIRTNTLESDLKKILYKFQQSDIKIFITNGYDKPKKIKIKKPPKEK